MKIPFTIEKSFYFKVFFFVLLLTGLSNGELLAQKGNNQIAIGAELGPVITARFHGYNYQVGLPVKIYYGIGNHGQLMLRSGFHHLWVPQGELAENVREVSGNLVPFALGYRRNLHNWYAEGSLGIAYEKGRTVLDHPYMVTARGGQYPLNYGVEVGYQLAKIDFGLSVQNNTVNHHHDLMHTAMVGFKAMYKIGL